MPGVPIDPHGVVVASLAGQLTGWVGRHGAYAVLAIMAIDALLPFGGEVTMLFAGALAAGAIAGAQPVIAGHVMSTGLQSYIVLALAGTLGYVLGAIVGWAIGRRGGRPLIERRGRFVHLTPENMERADRWFARHGRAAVFFGRLTPLVRSFISIPAGALEYPFGPYVGLTLAGSAIWCFAFAGAGWALGSSYDRVNRAFDYLNVAVAGGVVAVVVGVVVLRRQRRTTRV